MQMTKVLNYMELAYNLCPDALLIFGIDWPDIYRKKAAKKPDDLQTTHEEANLVVAPTDALILPVKKDRQQNQEQPQNEHSEARAGSTGENLRHLSGFVENTSGRTPFNKLRGTSNSQPDPIPINRVSGLQKANRAANRPSCPRPREITALSTNRKPSENDHSYSGPVYCELSRASRRQSEPLLLDSAASSTVASSFACLAASSESPARRVTTSELVDHIREFATSAESIGAPFADRAPVPLLPTVLDVSTGFHGTGSSTTTTSSYTTAVSSFVNEPYSANSCNQFRDRSTRSF
ncbi:Oidioi.mRNA.OKI2018_I69.PAR.g12377.t1.cds [Oikopleura dioica]|uniref:Oidioi.mRNA.OKI2018_I69.PAR.g12377.t1.cds n=1 Tax=Oikopleura dioica TaxID=34765 RepID=A0ABN7S7E3_OIKDI|nr:Oidioi.mRNA.OKI2018_I69.PAR.g12377.t1.cds [Oikopleura dioica]